MQQGKGFTLVELMIAVSLMSVVIISLLVVFSSFVQQQILSQNERVALSSIRFLVADITRDVSFGNEYTCGETVSGVCRCLALTDQLNRRIKIRYNQTNHQVEKSVQAVDASPNQCLNADAWTPLTDTAVNISGLSFNIDVR